jgi:hypothetical protein
MLAIATLLAACASRTADPAGSVSSAAGSSPSTAGSAPSSAPASPVDIDPEEGMVFRPLSNTPASALSPAEAWARYVRRIHSSRTRIPAAARVEYGKVSCVRCNLTQTRSRTPCGKSSPFNFGCLHVRTFAYSFAHTGCANSNPNYSPPPHLECTEWIFLNAFTGRMIQETWQQTNPPP